MGKDYFIEQPLAWFEPDDYFYTWDKTDEELDEQDTDLQVESEEEDDEHSA